MRSIFIVTMILFLLTACGADAQPAAPTATVTIPPTFTLVPAETPTATEAPPESQLPEGAQELAKKLEGTDYKLALNEQKEVVYVYVDPETKEETTIPELIINPDGTGAARKYIFTEEGYEPAELEVTYTADELVARDFSAWKIENGQWVRENTIDDSGKETKSPKYSGNEIVEMLIQDTNNLVAKLGKQELEDDSPTRAVSNSRGSDYLGFDGKTLSIRYLGMQFAAISRFVASNHLSVLNKNKEPMFDSDKNPVEYPVTFFVYQQLVNNQQSYVVWRKVDGAYSRYIVDAKLGTMDDIIKNNGIKPFTVIQQ